MFLQEKIQDINERLQVLKDMKNIVIWGAGMHTEKMFEMTDAISYNIKYIVDIDEKKQGKKYFGFVVEDPQAKVDWKNIDAAIISAYGKEKAIIKTLHHELDFNGQIIVLYESDERKPFYLLHDRESLQLSYSGDYNSWIEVIKERLNVKNWMPEGVCYTPKEFVQKRDDNRMLVGLLHCQETSCNMIRSLYDAFEADESCIPLVILQGKGYTNHYRDLETQMKKNEMRYAFDYNCADVKFDVLIVHHIQLAPTDDIKNIICNSTLRVAVPVGVISYNVQGLNADNIRAYKATEIFCEKSLYQKSSEKITREFHCHTTGNPKFDCIYDAYIHKVDIPEKLQKLHNPAIKKIILWTTDHKANNQLYAPDVAFDLYAETVFDYINRHPEIGLIFRPYRTYICELLRDGLMTEEQIDCFKKYCEQTQNIVWDDEPDYSASYSMADAILADAACGIICSALPLMKPMGITLRWDMDVNDILERNREILDNHYLISSKEEMISFFEMVAEGKDPDFQKRKDICNKYVTHFDGKNGERIKDIIKKIWEMNMVKENKS